MLTVETARLYLRLLKPSDLTKLSILLSDPDVVKYVGDGKPVALKETRVALTSIIKHWEEHGFGRWAVVDKSSRQFIGYGGLRMLIDMPEVVYHLAKPYWGKGLATEIASASLRFGFEEKGFDRIVAIAMPENAASIRVMSKVGMTFEKYATYYDCDVVQYSIRREEYQPADSPYILSET